MRRPDWSDAEKEFLKANYQTFGAPACAKALGRSVYSTRNVAQAIGVGRTYPGLSRDFYNAVLKEECVKVGMEFEAVMASRTTKRIFAVPRFRAWARLHKMGHSLPQIARRANRDHSTIHHGVAKAATIEMPPIPKVSEPSDKPRVRRAIKLIQPAGGIDRHMNTFRKDAA